MLCLFLSSFNLMSDKYFFIYFVEFILLLLIFEILLYYDNLIVLSFKMFRQLFLFSA